jgi:hypothetical protein
VVFCKSGKFRGTSLRGSRRYVQYKYRNLSTQLVSPIQRAVVPFHGLFSAQCLLGSHITQFLYSGSTRNVNVTIRDEAPPPEWQGSMSEAHATFDVSQRDLEGFLHLSVSKYEKYGNKQTPWVLKNGVFWVVTPCGSCKNRRFGGTWRLLHQGDKNR